MRQFIIFLLLTTICLSSFGQIKYKLEAIANYGSGSGHLFIYANNGSTRIDVETNGIGVVNYDRVIESPTWIQKFNLSYGRDGNVNNNCTTQEYDIYDCQFTNPFICNNKEAIREFDLIPLSDFTSINADKPSGTIFKACESVSFSINQFYGCQYLMSFAFEYAIGEGSWKDLIPYDEYDFVQGVHIDFEDIPGLSVEEVVKFRIRYVPAPSSNPSDYSTVLSYTFVDCSPQLVQDPPIVTHPKCSKSDNGSVTVQFDRSLVSNERMLIYVEKQFPNGSWDLFGNPYILDTNDINSGNGNTFNWPPNLKPNTYRIRYVSKYDTTGDIDPTPDTNNPNSDEQSRPFDIIAPDPVTFNSSKTDERCFESNDGTITFSDAEGGSNTGFQYSIDNGANWQSSATFTGLSPGTYTLLARDSNECETEANQQVEIVAVGQKFTLQGITVNEPSANGVSDGNISIDVFGGTGTITFQWQKDGANFATTQNISGLGPGTYTVVATDANGCTSDQLTFTLQEPPPLTVNVTLLQGIECHGDLGSIRAQGVGGSSENDDSYTYLWNTGSTNQSLLNITANTYTVTVTDSNDATATATFELTEPPVLSVTPTASNVLCHGGSDGAVNLDITGGTGAYTISWNDDDTITTSSRTGLAQGEYFYTVSDTNSCNINGSVTINEPPLINIQSVEEQPTAAGATDGTITITVSDGTAPYTYQWTDTNGTILATTKDISGLGAGDYTVTVRDANYTVSTDNLGCESTLLVTLVEPQTIAVNIIETQAVSCQGNDGILTAEVIGGTAPYEYQWLKEENGSYQDLLQNVNSITDLSAGNYRLIVNDVNDVTDQADVTLTDPGAITVTASSTDVSCNGGNNGSLQLNISDGLPPYRISWDDSAVTTENRLDLSRGEYFYTIEDANNCTINGSVIISEPDPITIVSDPQNPSTGNATDGYIDVTVSEGTPPYTYEWKNSNDDVIATIEDISGLGIDTYTLTVRDANYNSTADAGCEASIEITLVDPNVLSVNISETRSISCFGGNNGILEAQVTGGVEPYVYQWFKRENGSYVNLNQNVVSAKNLDAGNYRVVVTDENVDQVQLDYTLSQPEEILASSTITNVSCNGGNDGVVTLTITGGTGNYAITWLDDNTITSFDRTGLVSGEYFYTITDDNGCNLDSSIMIIEPPVMDITVENKQNPSVASANDGAIDISVTGGTPPYSYEWQNGHGDVVATSEDVNGLGVDTYTVTVRDANYNTVDDTGCEAIITVTLSDPTVLSVTITESQSVSCFGNSDGILTAKVIGGTSPYSYQWLKEDNGSYSDLDTNAISIENLDSGNYRVIVTDNSNTTAQADFNLSEPAAIGITENVQNVSCFGGNDGSIAITVTGGTAPYSFSWKNENDFEISTSEDLVNVVAGVYKLTVTDANDCVLESPITISEPVALLEITLDELRDPTAFGAADGFINVHISGGRTPYIFEWTDNADNVVSTEEDLSNVGEGVFTLTVTDDSGCSVSEQFALLAPDEMHIVINESIPILCHGALGDLQAFVTGGVLNTGSDYNYQWFREDSGSFVQINNISNILSDISAGTYRLDVTDDSNDLKSLTYTLISPDNLTISLAVSSPVSCTSGTDGAITSSVTGGTPPYSYEWNIGSEADALSDLPVGTYTLTVTDSNGCIAEEQIELTQPDGMSIDSNLLPPSCNGNSDGEISLVVSDGTAPYNYLWNTGATDPALNNLAAGEYSVTITDAAGCMTVQNFTLENPEPLVLDLGGDRVLCIGQKLELDATIEDQTASYQWTSDNGFSSTAPIVFLEQKGNYTLTVTNGNGCTASDTFQITTTNEVISADFLVPTQAFTNEVIVLIDVSEPVPDTVTWEFSEGTIVVSQNGDYAELKFEKEGVYTATMIANRGSCEAVLTKEIVVQENTDFGKPEAPYNSFIQEFKLFPNPNSGVFKVEVELLQSAPVSLRIINLSTNAIINTKIASGKDNYVFDYNVNLAIGVYLVLLETPKGTQVRKVMIK